jgi:hypothetical protein
VALGGVTAALGDQPGLVLVLDALGQHLHAMTTRGSVATCAGAASPPGSPASAGTPAPALGRHGCVVERTLGWLLSYRLPALRYDRSATTINLLARLAVTFICARRLPANGCNVF